MVFSCCVPNCKGNYPTGPKVQVFSLPCEIKNAELRRKWLSAVPRDFTPSKYTKVCELHFTEGDIIKVAECYDEKTGKKLSVPLTRPR